MAHGHPDYGVSGLKIRVLLAAVVVLIFVGGVGMAHGHPDYGVSGPKSTTFQLTDLAELAARMGSIVTYDRRGDVLWMDDFESANLGKWDTTNMFGSSAALVTVAARSGDQSVRLQTAADAADNAQIVRYLPYPAASRFGFETHFSLGNNLAVYRIEMRLYDGVNYYRAQAYYDPQGNTLQIVSAEGNVVTVASGVDLLENQAMFHAMKLVVDLATREHVRLLLNNREYNLSGIGIQRITDTTAPHLRIEVYVESSADGNQDAYVDDVIITQNEP